MIRTRSLTRAFGHLIAVDSIDLDVAGGEVVGFLGPNGAGKTTTLRMLAGYLPPTSGTAKIAGFDVRKESRDVRRRIGYLSESSPLYPEMRVIEYLRFRSRLYEMPRRERTWAIDTVVGRCWLEDVRRRPIGQLSRGYRQRVGLAAALLHNPSVLLLDEPTSGLDPTQIQEMRGLIRELADQHTVFLSTHILPEVEVTCDRVVIIARGKIRAQGTIEDLRRGDTDRICYVFEMKGVALSNGILGALRGVKEVRSSRLDDGWDRIMVRATMEAGDLREPIARILVDRGATVRELRRETSSLEQLFIRLTSDLNPAESARPEPDPESRR